MELEAEEYIEEREGRVMEKGSQEMGLDGSKGSNGQKGKYILLTLSSLADSFAEPHLSSKSNNGTPHRLLHQLLNK